MKRLFTILLLMLLVLLVGYGGAGVNMVSYCCEHCEELGTDVLTADDCCCGIHLQTFHEEHRPVSGLSSHNGHCELQRVQFDWNTFMHETFSFQPVLCCLPEFTVSLSGADVLLPFGTGLQPLLVSSPLPPRTYLSLLTLLLI